MRTKRPIHPGAVVGVDLITWLFSGIAIIIVVFWAAFWAWQPAVPEADGDIVCDFLNLYTRQCMPVLGPIGSLEIAGIVFLGVSMSVYPFPATVSGWTWRLARTYVH